MTLQDITTSQLATALEIYLRHAYADCPPPPAVRGLAAVDPAEPLDAALGRDGVVQVPMPDRPELIQKYRWRLGNDRYPHMQLGLDRCSSTEHFVFVVDTHDQNFPSGTPALEDPRFFELVERNSQLKKRIEAEWHAAGLPTFQAHLAQFLGDRCQLRGPQRKTVLIVDDDEDMLALEQALVEQAGYRVVTAAGGLEALDRLNAAGPVDLCLLDVMMPSLDGVAIARDLRGSLGGTFPIIYVTALPPGRAEDGIADEYVGKPFDPDHLLAVVHRHIG